MNSVVTTAQLCKRLNEQPISLTNLFLFRTKNGSMAPTNDLTLFNYTLNCVNYALIEFLVHIEWKDGSKIIPATLKKYFLKLKREFRKKYENSDNIVSEKVFSIASPCWFSVMDNEILSLLRSCETRHGYNIFGEKVF